MNTEVELDFELVESELQLLVVQHETVILLEPVVNEPAEQVAVHACTVTVEPDEVVCSVYANQKVKK